MQLLDIFNVITPYGRGAGRQSCFLNVCRAPFRGSTVSACLQWQGDMDMFYLGRFGRRGHGAVLTLNCIDIEALTMVKIAIR